MLMITLLLTTVAVDLNLRVLQNGLRHAKLMICRIDRQDRLCFSAKVFDEARAVEIVGIGMLLCVLHNG